MNIITNLGMFSSDITFFYIVAGDDIHYSNLMTSLRSVYRVYPNAKVVIGDFDNKYTMFLDKLDNYSNIKIIDLSYVLIDRNKIYKHIIWQYKYYISTFISSKYGIYLDTDTVLVNPIDNLIQDSNGKFLISKHFWVDTVYTFKIIAESVPKTLYYLNMLGLSDDMDFCAAGVFFFENKYTHLKILKDTFDLHSKIYENSDYILGIYDEPILNSVLQKNIENVLYYNGSMNHCSMPNMPMKLIKGVLYGKNEFDLEFKPITCLHCDKFRRDPSEPYSGEIKNMIQNLFEII